MTFQEYLDTAKKRIIELFAENGAMVDESIFAFYSFKVYDNEITSQIDYSDLEPFCSRKQLKDLRERMLNYAFVRVYSDCFFFTLTLDSLEKLASADDSEKEISLVLDKVQKLLALADTSKNDSEAEAVAASIAAQKLLAKHNLTMADLSDTREETIEDVCADVDGKKFKWTLAQTVAEAYCCKVYGAGQTAVVFHGYKNDALIARRVFLYLVGVCDRLAKHTVYEYRKTHYYADGVYNSFAKGFVSGVTSELKKSTTALALVVPPEVEKSYSDLVATFHGTINTHIDAYDAKIYREGISEGKKALNAQYITSENAGTKYERSGTKQIGMHDQK